MKSTPRLLLDLDGTLIDTAPDIAAALDLALADNALPPAGLAAVRSWIGGGAELLVRRALGVGTAGDQPAVAAVLARFFARYGETNGARAVPYPGVVATLESLRDDGAGMVCVTNKPAAFAAPLLSQLGMERYLDGLVAGDTLERKKPHAAPLNHALAMLPQHAGPAWMIGDSATDIAAARAAGLPSAWVPYGYNAGKTAAELNPTRVLSGFPEVLRLGSAP